MTMANDAQSPVGYQILLALAARDRHGYLIRKAVEQQTDGAMKLGPGTLYAAIRRLEDQGLIRSSWGISPEGRRAKFYTLTPAGRKRFAEEKANWRLFTSAVEQILHAT